TMSTLLVCCWCVMTSANGILIVNFPSCNLICISQTLATLSRSWFAGSWHNANACGESLAGSLSHQMKAWVSSINFMLTLSKTRRTMVHQNHHWSKWLQHGGQQPVLAAEQL